MKELHNIFEEIDSALNKINSSLIVYNELVSYVNKAKVNSYSINPNVCHIKHYLEKSLELIIIYFCNSNLISLLDRAITIVKRL